MIECAAIIKSGKCIADCCGCVPLPRDVWDKHFTEIQRPFSELIDFDGNIYPFTEDLKCVFLASDYSCVIYTSRPEICKSFGYKENLECPICKPSGAVRSEASKKQIERKMAKFQRETLKKMQRELRV